MKKVMAAIEKLECTEMQKQDLRDVVEFVKSEGWDAEELKYCILHLGEVLKSI